MSGEEDEGGVGARSGGGAGASGGGGGRGGGGGGTVANGGIGWRNGSLVGSKNPKNVIGYRYSTPSKRYRYSADGSGSGRRGEDGEDDGDVELPSNIQIQLRDRRGIELGGVLDVPTDSSADDLASLIRSLLSSEKNGDDEGGKVPYSLYAGIRRKKKTTGTADGGAVGYTVEDDDVEIERSLADVLREYAADGSISTERVLRVTYQPLALYRVRPVSRCTDTLPGHTDSVLHVRFSPDGRMMASGGGDTIVRFWDVNTLTTKYVGRGHKNHVLCTSWSPDGKKFVSADKNGVLIVWDPHFRNNRKASSSSTSDEKNGTDVENGGGDDENKAGEDGEGGVDDKDKKSVPKHVIRAHKRWITSISWEPMHKNAACERLITGGKDGTIRMWNVRTKTMIRSMSGHTDSVECVVWGGQDALYSASRDRTIKVWNADRGILIRTLSGHGHRVNTLALSSDYVLRTGPYDQKCERYGSPEEAREAAERRYEQFQRQQKSDDDDGAGGGERLVSGSDDYTMFLWDPKKSKHPLKRLTGHQQPVNHIAFSPDGRYFASASFDKKIKLWDGYSGDFVMTFTGHVGPVYQLSWSNDGRFLVSASKDSTAKLWDVENKNRHARETLPGHADEVYALDWSPNGSSVATGSKDRTIKIWKH